MTVDIADGQRRGCYRPDDRQSHRPRRCRPGWDTPRCETIRTGRGCLAFDHQLGNRYRPMRYVPSMADGSFRLVVLPGKGFLVAFIQYQSDRFLPAGVPNKRMPGAPPMPSTCITTPCRSSSSRQISQPSSRSTSPPEPRRSRCDLTFDSGVVRTGTVQDQEGRPLSRHDHGRRDAEELLPIHFDGRPQFHRLRLVSRPEAVPDVDLPTWRRRGSARRCGSTAAIPARSRYGSSRLASLTGRLVDATGKPEREVELRLLRIVEEPCVGANGEFSPPLASHNRPGRPVSHRRDHPGHRLLAPDVRGPVLQSRLLDAHEPARSRTLATSHPKPRTNSGTSRCMPDHDLIKRAAWAVYQPSENDSLESPTGHSFAPLRRLWMRPGRCSSATCATAPGQVSSGC